LRTETSGEYFGLRTRKWTKRKMEKLS